MGPYDKLRRGCRAGTMILLLALFGSLPLTPSGHAQTAGPAPGYARIWLYRTYEPFVTAATPYVRMNGQIVGVSYLGQAFPVDVPAGFYTITADSIGTDVNQFDSVSLAPGETVFVKVDASRWWWSSKTYEIDTFYTRLTGPRMARLECPSCWAAPPVGMPIGTASRGTPLE